MYHVLCLVPVLFIAKYFIVMAVTLQNLGFTKSYVRKVTLKPTLLFGSVVIYWLLGVIAACSNFSSPKTVTLFDVIYAFASTSLCFWIAIIVLLKKKSASSPLQESLLQQYSFLLSLTL